MKRLVEALCSGVPALLHAGRTAGRRQSVWTGGGPQRGPEHDNGGSGRDAPLGRVGSVAACYDDGDFLTSTEEEDEQDPLMKRIQELEAQLLAE